MAVVDDKFIKKASENTGTRSAGYCILKSVSVWPLNIDDDFEVITRKLLSKISALDKRMQGPAVQNLSSAITIETGNYVSGEGTMPPIASPRKPFFIITRTGNVAFRNDYHWAISAGLTNPANAADFLFPTNGFPKGSLIFEPGETIKRITLTINPDATVEQNENYILTVTDEKTGIAYTQNGVITNDD